eukprot:510934-Rhodomonas_salina.2
MIRAERRLSVHPCNGIPGPSQPQPEDIDTGTPLVRRELPRIRVGRSLQSRCSPGSNALPRAIRLASRCAGRMQPRMTRLRVPTSTSRDLPPHSATPATAVPHATW